MHQPSFLRTYIFIVTFVLKTSFYIILGIVPFNYDIDVWDRSSLFPRPIQNPSSLVKEEIRVRSRMYEAYIGVDIPDRRNLLTVNKHHTPTSQFVRLPLPCREFCDLSFPAGVTRDYRSKLIGRQI